jgi:peptide deformylase
LTAAARRDNLTLMVNASANEYQLRYLDDPVLRKKSAAVEVFGEEEAALVRAMTAIMAAHRGVGLAAPQAGVGKRIIVVHAGLLPEGADTILVNPEVVSRSEEETTEEEGCLSLLSVATPLARPARITVRYRDVTGRPRELEARDFGARAVVHEIDHLDGVLFIDHLSRLKRKQVCDRFRRLRRELGLEG